MIATQLHESFSEQLACKLGEKEECDDVVKDAKELADLVSTN